MTFHVINCVKTCQREQICTAFLTKKAARTIFELFYFLILRGGGGGGFITGKEPENVVFIYIYFDYSKHLFNTAKISLRLALFSFFSDLCYIYLYAFQTN